MLRSMKTWMIHHFAADPDSRYKKVGLILLRSSTAISSVHQRNDHEVEIYYLFPAKK
jgi:hypothetical protein